MNRIAARRPEHYGDLMQAKDIPVMPVLAFLESCRRAAVPFPGAPGTLSVREDGSLLPNSVQHGMPVGVPKKLARAKMASLIHQKLVDGCVCGCRGDFKLTEKGVAHLASLPAQASTGT